MKKNNVLCLIPARSGSKSIKNKNIKNLGGKPLIYWTIKQAKKSKCFSKIIVSTDSSKIKKISIKYGAEVPFLRPKKISSDKSSTIDAVKHAIDFFYQKEKIEYNLIFILQPTSPLRSANDIKNSLRKIKNNYNATSLVSVSEVEDNHPARMYYLRKGFLKSHMLSEKKNGTPRQSLKKMYLRNGSIYILKNKNLKSNFLGNAPLAFIMPKSRSINIDDKFDFKIANLLIKKNEKKNSRSR